MKVKQLRQYLGLCLFVFTMGCEKAKFNEVGGLQRSLKEPDQCHDNQSPQCQGEVGKPEFMIDTFTQNTQSALAGKVDILIVEDTSLSMRTDRWTLGKRFEPLLKEFSQMDWQAGVTTTAINSKWTLNGRLYPWNAKGDKILNPKSRHGKKALRKTIGFEMCPGGDAINQHPFEPCATGNNEESLKAGIMTIQRLAKIGQLFRKKAGMAMIFISDEEENRSSRLATTPNNLLDEVTEQLGRHKKIRAYGVIIQPGDESCLKSQSGFFADPGASYGFSISDLARKTEGTTVSICSKDFTPLFQAIRKDFDDDQDPLFTTVKLTHPPIFPEQLKVKFKPEVNISWSLKGQHIIFSKAPPEGTKIEIRYKYMRKL